MNIQLNGGENNMNGGDLGSRKGLSPSPPEATEFIDRD